MQMPVAVGVLWLLQLFLLMGSLDGASFARGEEQLEALLDTETQLIDQLRDYIDRLELQLEEIQRETSAIEEIHSQVDNVEDYMGNPLNVLTILKRFDSVWPTLEQHANATHQLNSGEGFLDSDLILPTEEDYEESLSHLLHLQSVYDLEPASLSLGVVNGWKLGSAMSWGDCLEVARKSDFSVARFWLETALEKLPSASENSTESHRERESGRVQILEATLNIEYRAGELSRALATVDELLLLLPMNQNLQKAKKKIEKALAKKELPKAKGQKSKTKTQLELAVNVPRGSLLHWHTRSAGGSSSEWDYRSGQAVCPVLLGVQLSAWTGLN
uniref:Prolyl 4-hydroxylase subunit alpha-1 n=1 Tax=Drosophila rhopaloa TaxID=1041015 RepID=A0A6P4FDR9_DRORH